MGFIEVFGIAALMLGDAQKLPVQAVYPTVVLALKALFVAGKGATNNRTAVATAIEHHMDATILAATHNYGPQANISGLIIARIRNFAIVADIDPASPKNLLHLEAENFGIRIDATADTKIVRRIED